MNIFKKTVNNLRYAYYRKLGDKALAKMHEHQLDADDREWKKWAKIEIKTLKKRFEIPIK